MFKKFHSVDTAWNVLDEFPLMLFNRESTSKLRNAKVTLEIRSIVKKYTKQI